MNRIGIILGVLVLAIAILAAPMPLEMSLSNPTRTVVIYPNLLFAFPMVLLGLLLLLYGATAKKS